MKIFCLVLIVTTHSIRTIQFLRIPSGRKELSNVTRLGLILRRKGELKIGSNESPKKRLRKKELRE